MPPPRPDAGAERGAATRRDDDAYDSMRRDTGHEDGRLEDMADAQAVCDRIGIFVKGRLRACGTVDELATGIDDRWVFSVGVADVEAPDVVLRAIPGVRSVQRSEGRWLVQAERDLRSEIHEAVLRAGGRFTHLSREGADLDAIYHRYFHQDAPDTTADTTEVTR